MSPRAKLDSQGNLKLLQVTTVPLSLFFFRGQTDYMKAKGMDFRVLTSPGAILDRFTADESVQAHPVTMQRQITPFKDIFALSQIVKILRSVQPTIVHAHTPKGGLLGMIGAWLARVPVRIYHIRGLPYLSATGPKRHLMMWTERISCALAHQVLAVSPSMREAAIADRICPPDKIKVLLGGSGNGVDTGNRFNPDAYPTEQRRSLREGLGIGDDDKVIGYIGRIVRDKGIEELASAWSSLRSQFPDAVLVLVGTFEDEDPVAPDIVHQLKTDSRVRIIPWVDNPAPYFSIFDLFTMPSYREGFGNVLIEAASMEVPTVATRIPGCVDAVQDGVTGTLVPPKDADALRQAIERYLDDPELRERHGKAGRERVLRDFRQEAIWEALYQEYVSLLEQKGIAAPAPVTMG